MINGRFFPVQFVMLLALLPRSQSNFVNESINRSPREVGKRYLVFPEGSSVQLVYCLTMPTYSKPAGMFTLGLTAGLAWELPSGNTVPYRGAAEVYHRRSRRDLYRKVELMLKTQGQDGKACVLKAICGAANRSREDVGQGTFIEEILHTVFTLPVGSFDDDPMTEYEKTYWLGEKCDDALDRCPDIF